MRSAEPLRRTTLSAEQRPDCQSHRLASGLLLRTHLLHTRAGRQHSVRPGVDHACAGCKCRLHREELPGHHRPARHQQRPERRSLRQCFNDCMPSSGGHRSRCASHQRPDPQLPRSVPVEAPSSSTSNTASEAQPLPTPPTAPSPSPDSSLTSAQTLPASTCPTMPLRR